MRLSLAAIGDVSLATGLPAASCGVNPCTWVDDIWVRDKCLAFLRCADPCNPLLVGYSAADAGNCAALQIANTFSPGAAPPNLAPINTALTPGVPVGYDPTTGQVDPSNTTGATEQPTPEQIAAAWQNVRASLPDQPVSWWCSNIGIGCAKGITAGGIAAVLGLGVILFYAAKAAAK
jgi:hypothetical protein